MAVSNVLSSFMGHCIFSYCIFVFVVILQVHIWARVIRVQRSSLSRIPGPRFAKWSRLWIAKAISTGRSHEIWTETNNRYGRMARIGPNHVVTDDPSITRRVLAARSGYSRSSAFDSLRMDPEISNIVSEKDGKKHSSTRAKLAPSFAGRSLATIEPMMDEQVLVWIDSLRRSSSQVIDIGQKIQFLTVDIITRVCLGDAVGCVRNDQDMFGLLETIEIGNQVAQYFSVFTELCTLLFSLSRIPFLKRAIFPKVTDSHGVGRVMGLVHKVAAGRSEDKRDDLVSALIGRGMPTEQIDSEVIVTLAGGSDTTSTSVQSTLLCIASNPQVYAALRSEIRTALQEGKISTPIRDAEAKQLVYLQAVVLEGLRKHPPLSQLRERVVPAGGDTLGGFHLPAGTFVGFNGWGTQLNTEVYGDDAKLFRPERWIAADEDRLREMHACHSLIFGHGATKCLGMGMAMMEIPKVIFELLRNFDVTIANPHKPWTSHCYGIFHQKGFCVVLKPVGERDEPPPAYDGKLLD
ncbi:hypothetical protein PFICI_13449 [Pestalotiopsis fici W106-1]|uniref:Pisatin demethylase n=1 Tax=Pestalotiopsis fici (strain W106-1 / CGMCC3.15140) TaxID=1229662 RepID=W3WM12_PESFW|nr:uncharacterized protein PFICI_13449 [Pestalotiopsis fici W106-1]ETS74965.1 hypothetical protein PFICI_13449 [Pestalotiopsis fici W106-1]